MLQAKPIGKASHQASQYAVEAVGSLITSIDIKISVDEQPYSLEQSIEKSIKTNKSTTKALSIKKMFMKT